MQKPHQYKKINSFSMRPSPAQIFTYTVIALQACIFYIMIRPNIKSEISWIILTALFSASLASLIITALICSYIDPSDTVMIKHKNGNTRQFKDRLAQLSYCQYCRTNVSSQAKHCRQCGRCVQRFDHHCIWINNCVGIKNYSIFIAMIVSAFTNLGTYLAAVVVISVQKQWNTFLGFIITIWTVMVIVFILWFLLFNLNLLHIYLKCKGYTTYQFIVARKQQQRVNQMQKINKKAQKEYQKAKKKKQQEQKKQSAKLMQNKIQEKTETNVMQNKNKQMSELNLKEQKSNLQSDSKIQIIGKNKNNLKEIHLGDDKLKQNIHEEKINNIFNEQQAEKTVHIPSQHSKFGDLQIKNDMINEQIKNKQDDGNFSRSSSNQSVKINSFFMKNKSYGLILGNQKAYSPQKKLASTSFIVNSTNKKRLPIALNQSRSRSTISIISNSNQSIIIKSQKESQSKLPQK